jgi:hypothetical protein
MLFDEFDLISFEPGMLAFVTRAFGLTGEDESVFLGLVLGTGLFFDSSFDNFGTSGRPDFFGMTDAGPPTRRGIDGEFGDKILCFDLAENEVTRSGGWWLTGDNAETGSTGDKFSSCWCCNC